MSRLWSDEAFNVAPYSSRRPSWVWGMLVASSLGLVLALWPMQAALDGRELARSRLLAAQRAAQQDATELRTRVAQSQSHVAQERAKYRLAVEQAIQVSWDGIFDTLEWAAQSVNARVSIISLTPTKVQGDTTQIRITALATEVPALLHYLEVLKHDPRVIQADLVSQHPEERAGPKVVRFRIDATLNTRMPRPARPAASSAQSPSIPASSAMSDMASKPAPAGSSPSSGARR